MAFDFGTFVYHYNTVFERSGQMAVCRFDFQFDVDISAGLADSGFRIPSASLGRFGAMGAEFLRIQRMKLRMCYSFLQLRVVILLPSLRMRMSYLGVWQKLKFSAIAGDCFVVCDVPACSTILKLFGVRCS